MIKQAARYVDLGTYHPAAGGIGDLGAEPPALGDFYDFSNVVILGIFGLKFLLQNIL